MNITSKNTKPFNSNQSNILIEDEYIKITKRLDEKIFLTEIKIENAIIKMKDEFQNLITITHEDAPFLLSNISEMEIYENEKLLNVYNVVYSSIGLKRKRIIEDNFVSNKKKKFWFLEEVVYPKYWVPQKNEIEVFDVKCGSEEYNDVLCDFLNELYYYDVKVKKLTRVQNLNLFKWYYLRRYDVQCKLGKKDVEKMLYHGTSLTAIDGIVIGGLDNRLSKLTGANGAGVYFAKSPITSLHYLDIDAEKLKMLICRAVTGRSEKGAKNLTRPPILRNSTERDRADSVKAELGHDKTFTVYDTYQSYPEYIVEFEINKEKVNIPKGNKINQGNNNSTNQPLNNSNPKINKPDEPKNILPTDGLINFNKNAIDAFNFKNMIDANNKNMNYPSNDLYNKMLNNSFNGYFTPNTGLPPGIQSGYYVNSFNPINTFINNNNNNGVYNNPVSSN